MDEADLASSLSHLPSLARLDVRTRLWSKGRLGFISTLASLRHLTTLDIGNAGLVMSDFGAVAWECPLETLSLAEPLSFSSYFTPLRSFSFTLQTLHVCPSTSMGLDYERSTPTFDAALPLPRCTPPIHTEASLDSFFRCPI